MKGTEKGKKKKRGEAEWQNGKENITFLKQKKQVTSWNGVKMLGLKTERKQTKTVKFKKRTKNIFFPQRKH